MFMKSLGLTAIGHAATDSVCAVAFFCAEVDRPWAWGLGHSCFHGKSCESCDQSCEASVSTVKHANSLCIAQAKAGCADQAAAEEEPEELKIMQRS